MFTPLTAPTRKPERDLIPRPLLLLILALVLASASIAAFSALTGRPTAGQPKAAAVVAERELVLRTGDAQAVALYAADGTLLQDLPHGGFVTVVASAVDRARIRARVPLDLPVTLSRLENGRLIVTDPATGLVLELTVFGSDNEAAFQALLPQS